jgi:hypothetical protein
LPADAEARLVSFTELVATAIANADSRAALARLAEEQAALRRVATLVARATARSPGSGMPPWPPATAVRTSARPAWPWISQATQASACHGGSSLMAYALPNEARPPKTPLPGS